MRLRFPNKAIRAAVIAAHVRAAGLPGVVCFSCGNASRALRERGLYVVDVSPSGPLQPNRWWAPDEIAKAWPHLYDATSGHLPVPMMGAIGAAFRAALGPLPAAVEVPSGSGETVVALALAYPETEFTAVYGGGPATEYSPHAPLNGLVRRLCAAVVHEGTAGGQA